MNNYNVIITSRAQSDLADCVRFALNVSKEAATNLANDIYSSLDSLSSYPERNPVFNMPKQFLFIIRKHIINKRYAALYSVEGDKVVVYRIIDARRKFNYILG